MEEVKPLIGLKWEPKLPGLSLDSSSSKGADKLQSGLLWTSKSELVDGLCLPPTDPRKVNKMIRKQLKDTAGADWFDMPAPTMTPELKRDLQMLKLRTVMDRSQHYKKSIAKTKLGEKYFQVGTVIEATGEFYNGRLNNRDRKSNLADDLVSDPKLTEYRKRKIREIEEKNREVQNSKWGRKGKQSKNSKQRRN